MSAAGTARTALLDRVARALDRDPGSLALRLIDAGRSNVTYRLTDGTDSWVVRHPPLGHILATAHDMSREFRVMRALADTDVPVPRMVVMEDDTSIIGAPFYVMEFIDGPVIRTEADARLLSATQASAVADDLVDQLARLHDIDPERVGLADLGRPDGFMLRQIRRWARQWSDSGGDDAKVPFLQLAAALERALPLASRTGIVHGDYRLDNTILDGTDPSRIAAIIDWELATLGDPLADVGVLLTYWSPLSAPVTGLGHPTSCNPGFPAASHLVSRYEQTSGRDVDDLAFYTAFGHFKLAGIAQGIFARALQQTDPDPKTLGAIEAVPTLVTAAFEILDEG